MSDPHHNTIFHLESIYSPWNFYLLYITPIYRSSKAFLKNNLSEASRELEKTKNYIGSPLSANVNFIYLGPSWVSMCVCMCVLLFLLSKQKLIFWIHKTSTLMKACRSLHICFYFNNFIHI